MPSSPLENILTWSSAFFGLFFSRFWGLSIIFRVKHKKGRIERSAPQVSVSSKHEPQEHTLEHIVNTESVEMERSGTTITSLEQSPSSLPVGGRYWPNSHGLPWPWLRGDYLSVGPNDLIWSLNLSVSLICKMVINYKPCPGWCGSEGWALACKLKGRQFDSQSGHMSGLRARSLVGDILEAANQCISCTLMFLSLPFSLPAPLFKNK